jgi:hypothetical protein
VQKHEFDCALAANGDRKSTGSNFGCTLCSKFFPIPFPNHPVTARWAYFARFINSFRANWCGVADI